jgi:hypothetical protein
MSTSGIFNRIWRWAKWPLAVVVVLYAADVIWATSVRLNGNKTDAAVAAIHAQKITLADVTGENLPLPPDQVESDATVEGIDANQNGVRDDVEWAIFKAYPHDPKIRAAELQYAMTEQMFLTKVFNTETWKAVAEEDERAFGCLASIKGNRKQIEMWVFNTSQRAEAKGEAFDFTTSHGQAPGNLCDVSV